MQHQDEFEFRLLYNHIRLSKEQGILIFLSCRTPDVENFLVDKLKAELAGEFPFRMIPLEAWDYAPLHFIGANDFSAETLYIVGQFPFEDFYKNQRAMDNKLQRLATTLNIARELFSARDLKCIIICPPEVENYLALKAPDFYLFSQLNLYFSNDRKPRKEVESLEEIERNKNNRERIAFLLEALEIAEREEVKGEIYAELGKLYSGLSEWDNALDRLQEGAKIYRKCGNRKGLASVLGHIGLIYRALAQPEEALKYLKESKLIYRRMKIPVPDTIMEGMNQLVVSST